MSDTFDDDYYRDRDRFHAQMNAKNEATKASEPVKDLETLAAAYHRLRFGNKPPTVQQCEEADAALARLRRLLNGNTPGSAR